MSETVEYTKGPWKVSSECGCVQGAKPDHCIAVVNFVSQDCAIGETARADRNLIAAAPDMYEALKALLDADVYSDAEGLVSIANPATEDGEAAVKRAFAALSKAEARS